jgi:hypothetical protein
MSPPRKGRKVIGQSYVPYVANQVGHVRKGAIPCTFELNLNNIYCYVIVLYCEFDSISQYGAIGSKKVFAK